jgi:hypothetical protein
MALIFPIVSKFDPAGLRKAQREFGGFGKSMRNVLGAVGLGVSLQSTLNLLQQSVTAASDYGESLNAVNVSWGKNASAILKLGENAAKTVGLSKTEFNGLAVGFSSFAEKIAGKGGDAVGIFKNLAQRGADFASVMNIKGGVNEAMMLFRSGLAGETEPLRKYGIDMSAAAIETFALNNHLVKNKKDLTESIKVQARYGWLMEQTTKTQGDFANTFGGLANQQRYMAAATEDLKNKFGQMLLPTMTKVVTYLNETVIPMVSKFLDDVANPKTDAGKAFRDIKDAVKIAFTSVKDFFAMFGDGDAMKGFANIAKSLASALPALLALKGIMVLASAGKSIANLVTAMRIISGKDAVSDVSRNTPGLVKVAVAGEIAANVANSFTRDELKKKTGQTFLLGTGGMMALPTNLYDKAKPTIVVNSYGSTPAEFDNLIKRALDRHNRVNGKP